jgi:hypothetical protein
VRTLFNFKVGVLNLQELPLPSSKCLLLESPSKSSLYGWEAPMDWYEKEGR